MAARPPRDTSDPKSIEFGIAAVDARLDEAELSFPADRETVARELGDDAIPYDAYGHSVAVAEALAKTGYERFDSRQELMNALYDVFEEYRASTSTSVIAHVRSLLPF